MTVYGGWCLASGWPIFTALHVRDLPEVLEWAAAALTIVIGASAFDALARWVSPAPERATVLRTTSATAGSASPR
jgi:hypothetical protein